MEQPSPNDVVKYANGIAFVVTQDMWQNNPEVMKCCLVNETVGFDIDGQEFCDYYSQRGWMIFHGRKRVPMINWRLEVNSWARRSLEWGKFKPYKVKKLDAGSIIDKMERERQDEV